MDNKVCIKTCLPKIEALDLPNDYKKSLIENMDYIGELDIADLRYIILFGSCARGSVKAGSDIDLLLITNQRLDRDMRGEIASYFDDVYKNISTDAVFYTVDDFNKSSSQFIQEIKKDGIILWKNVSDEEVN